MLPRRQFSTRRSSSGTAAWAAKASAANRIDHTRLSAISDEIARTPADAIAFAHEYKMQWLESAQFSRRQGRISFAPGRPPQAGGQGICDGGIKISFLNSSMLKFGLPGTEPAAQNARKA